MSLNWNSLFLTGTVVTLKTSRWSARLQLKASDLGIEDSAEVQSALSLGCHRLAPASAFGPIREILGAARRTVDHYSLNFGLIKGARYVPDQHMDKLMPKLRQYKEDFDGAVDEFIGNYEQVKATQFPIIVAALHEAAKSPEAAELAFERIQAEYPTEQEIRNKFNLRWSIYTVQGAKTKSVMDAAENEAEDVKEMIGEMVGQLRTELTDKVKSLLEITKKGGKLSKTSLDSAWDVLERVESLNVLNDQVLRDQVNALKASLGSIDRQDVGDEFITGLESMQTELEESVELAVEQAEQSLTGLGKRKIGG